MWYGSKVTIMTTTLRLVTDLPYLVCNGDVSELWNRSLTFRFTLMIQDDVSNFTEDGRRQITPRDSMTTF